MNENETNDVGNASAENGGVWRWVRAIGPGLVTACVVIGPGSILTSSKVGASAGFSNSWVVVVSVFFMMIYMTLGAKLGVVAQKSPADLTAERAGRWLAVLVGFGVFVIAATFQFGNNLGVHSALNAFYEHKYWIVYFNGLSLIFVFGFRNMYQVIEKLMTVFVAVMLIAFAVNLWAAGLDLKAFFAGLNPMNEGSKLELPLLALVGTTFSSAAAYYQTYLVRFKGWTTANLRSGLFDARVGSLIMAVITLMIMATAAAVLRGQDLKTAADVANQLTPLFGEQGKIIFCVGLFAAAFSSFIVNSMIGGFMLSDSLNLGSMPSDRWPRILTAIVLLIGMGVALYVLETDAMPVTAIVFAQAMVVIAAPLMAGVLLWLTNVPEIMGEHRNGWLLNVVASLGFILLTAVAGYTAVQKVIPGFQKMFS